MNRYVKVLFFPSNFRSRSQNDALSDVADIQLEDENGERFAVRAVHVATRLTVGCWYWMHVVSSIGQLYGFTYSNDRNAASARNDETARLISESVTIVEVPGEENDDEFRLQLADGSMITLPFERVSDYFAVGDTGIATLRVTRLHTRAEALRHIDGVTSQFPIAPCTVSQRRGRFLFHSGYRWLSLKEALDKGFCKLEDVGTLLETKRLASGAIGSAMEYSVNAYVWKVGREIVVDASEENGTDFQVFTRKKDVDRFLKQLMTD